MGVTLVFKKVNASTVPYLCVFMYVFSAETVTINRKPTTAASM